jgi:hypothetical protein
VSAEDGGLYQFVPHSLPQGELDNYNANLGDRVGIVYQGKAVSKAGKHGRVEAVS